MVWLSTPNISTSHTAQHPPCIIDTVPTFEFPAVARKKITAAFDGGRIFSDEGSIPWNST